MVESALNSPSVLANQGTMPQRIIISSRSPVSRLRRMTGRDRATVWCECARVRPAKVDASEAWREYRSIEDIPALNLNGGISAQLWTGTGGTSFVRTVEPGEDISIYTEYCFTDRGQLSRVGLEVRTAWGWAYRLESPVENGAIHDPSSGFFSTQTEKSIAKPEQADDVSQALRPTLYPQASQLPFSQLLDTFPKSGLPLSPK